MAAEITSRFFNLEETYLLVGLLSARTLDMLSTTAGIAFCSRRALGKVCEWVIQKLRAWEDSPGARSTVFRYMER